MSVSQTSAYCATCDQQTLHVKPKINHLLHLLLTVLTIGIWGLLVWLPLGLIHSSKRARCARCGSRQGAKSTSASSAGAEQLQA